MMNARDEFLTFQDAQGGRTASLPPDLLFLITDTLEAPGDILIASCISRSVKEGRKTILVGLLKGFEHWNGILRKASVQLPALREKGVFSFVDVPPDEAAPITFLSQSLAQILDQAERPVIILDDLSSLIWSGETVQDVVRLVASLKAVLSEIGASLVLLQHGDDLGDPSGLDSELFRALYRRSDVWLQTTGLSLQSRGELEVHRGPALCRDIGLQTRSGDRALQYKLEESGAAFSAKGLVKGFV